MDRRVPKSEKYAHIQSSINTGLTVHKVKYVTAREYSKRRDEIFFRITKQQLYELFNEYEAEFEESFSDSSRSNSGVNIVSHSADAKPTYERPYLILDAREEENFDSCRILHARSFPHSHLRRDQLHKDVYKFKNKVEHLIIVYCNDERISKDYAKLLVDRGIDNVYLLTGGLNEFASEYIQFIEGIPLDLPGSRSGSKASTRAGDQGRGTRSYRGSLDRISEDGSPTKGGGGYFQPSDANKLTPRKLNKHNETYDSASSSHSPHQMGSPGSRSARSEVSIQSNMSVAESVISRANNRKGRF
jgi:centrosomal protein CEP41